MQAYIKYKAYYDEKLNASKFKERHYVYALQPTADHQGREIPFTNFRKIGPYIVGKTLPNSNNLVKNGTDKTQTPHRMQLLSFTPKEPILDEQNTPQEWKSDREVIIKHDDLYARAWESDFGKLIFDIEPNQPSPPNPCKVMVKTNAANAGTCGTPVTPREGSPEIFPRTDASCEGTGTYPSMESDAEMSLEQPSPTPTNPRNTKYDLRHNPKPNCNEDYRS